MSDDLYRLIKEPGKHLADSNGTQGAVRGVYLDDVTNKPCGAGEFVKVEEDDDLDNDSGGNESSGGNAAAIAITLVLGIGIGVATVKAYPRVKGWFMDKVVPKAEKIYCRITNKPANELPTQENNKQKGSGISNLSVDAFSQEVDEVINEYKKNMCSEEAKTHLLNIMRRAMYMASEIRKLSDTIITDIDLSKDQMIELKSSMEKLTTKNITDSINLILAQKIPKMDAVTVERISATLGTPLIAEGEFIPIKNEIFKEALDLGNVENSYTNSK